MAKNIVLCSDGTGNDAKKLRGTNILRLFQAIDIDGANPTQVAVHDDGVGSQGFKPLRMISGATGLGLSSNIRQIYRFLCTNYEPGDKIYLFGFSRGAYTVRAVTGMILRCGVARTWDLDQTSGRKIPLANTEFNNRVRAAYRAFRKSYRQPSGNNTLSDTEIFRNEYAVHDATHAPRGKVEIKFVGVWDTVDAVGLPIDELAQFFDRFVWKFRFPEKELGARVKKGCHALAIDDARHTFHPVLWDERHEQSVKPDEAPRIEQVWFSGMHADVGGGYARSELALVSLNWMMEKAKQHGLIFQSEKWNEYRAAANPLGTLHNSRAGPAVYYRYKPRHIQEISADCGISKPVIHASVLTRIASPFGQFSAAGPGRIASPIVPYFPLNLPGANGYEIAEQQQDTLVESAGVSRANMLEMAWDIVWWRRVLYFSLLCATFVSAFVGYLPATARLATDPLVWPVVGHWIGYAGQFAPAFLGNLINTFASRPDALALVVATFVLLYLFRSRLHRLSRRSSEVAWQLAYGAQVELLRPSLLHRVAHVLRTSPIGRAWVTTLNKLGPWVLLVALLAGLGYAFASQILDASF